MKNYNPYRYNRYRKLPKAETGMNLRGPRNQLAKQEVSEKSVGTWLKDAGKWMLNMAVSPFELISGTNFYDPEMAHSGWQDTSDITEGIGKGVGDALGYVYGGPMYAGLKEGVSGIADAAGAEDAIRGTQYGGRISKAQTGNQYGTPISTQPNQLKLGFPNGAAGAAQMGQINQGVTGVMNGTQHFCQGGNCPPPTAGGQPPMGSPGGGGVGGGQTPQMLGGAAGGAQQPQKPNPYLSDPNGDQGWATAVGEAASDPVGAVTNMVGAIATAGDNPIHAEDYGAYIDAAANTGSHPGDLFNLWGNIGEGTTPVTAKINRENKAKSDGYADAKQGMRGVMKQLGGRIYQMGGAVEDPYLRTAAINARTNQQGGRDQTALKIGQAIQATGNVVGESLSGMGMGGGGGGAGGGMGGMMGGMMGGEGGGMMGGMTGGGEGGGGFDMNSIMGMFGGGGEGGGFDMSSMMSVFQQNGGRVPVRKVGRSKKYQNGEEVKPEDMPREATAADRKRINEWLNNTKMVDTPYPPTDSTDNPYYNIMNEIDVLTDPHQRSYEDCLDQPFQYGGIPKAQMGGGLMGMLGKLPGMDMIQKLMGGLGGGGGQGGGGMDMSSIMEKMQNIDPEQMQAMQGMFKDGFSAEGLGNAIGGEQGKGIGDIVGGFMKGGGGGATKENGGRLAKTSNLPMDMEGFTDLEQGFNRSNTIEINSGNNHSDLNDPHTPLNIPVPSFDEQGNSVTENVQILAEKGEFARKDPDTEAVTIFSKNLKTKDSSGKRTNYAKIAEKLGKKEERLTAQAKNPFDDIKDASIQRALSNVKNKFIRLEEEQKGAKELKEEEDRMDLMQLAKNGGRITKKNTYKVPGRKTSKVLSEYQKDLLGMDDQGQMPMAQNGNRNGGGTQSYDPTADYDPTLEDIDLGLTEEEKEIRRKEIEEAKEYRKKNRKEYIEERKQERKDARSGKREQRHLERERRKLRKRGGEDVSDLAQQIADLPDGATKSNLFFAERYQDEGAREAQRLLEEEYRPLDLKGGLPCPPCEDGSIPSRDGAGNCLDCYSLAPEDEEETGEQQQQQQRREGASGDKAINDYINNLRGINADVEAGLTPYQNYFEDYGRETEDIMRNTLNDLPRYYEDRSAHLNAANVNALENQIRNMSGIGSSGYLANMQAAKHKELRANNDFLAQSQGQEDARLGKLAEMIGQHRQVEATGATVADDRTREAEDALNSAKYDTEKNILTGRLAQTREENSARRNELLDSQMQWMYNNDRTQYDKDANPVNPGPATAQYGGKIKRDMYEYGSRVKREKQMKSDRAMNDFRSFMSDYNKK